jgi:diadenosine tetraphosphate (Ap4A) HIT family hydrolase
MAYDSNNIFAKILRGEIPCKKIFEDEFAIAFHDIAPKAPVHALVIPKGSYVAFEDFAANASDCEIAGFNRAVQKVVAMLDVAKTGYRLIANSGVNSGQEVPHYHVHILAGRHLGPMLAGK